MAVRRSPYSATTEELLADLKIDAKSIADNVLTLLEK